MQNQPLSRTACRASDFSSRLTRGDGRCKGQPEGSQGSPAGAAKLRAPLGSWGRPCCMDSEVKHLAGRPASFAGKPRGLQLSFRGLGGCRASVPIGAKGT